MSLKSALKTTIATVWAAGERLLPARPKLTILYYHAVPDACAAAFDAQMQHLRATANIVGADYVGLLESRRPNVAVTFDDAFRTVRENALPALLRHSIPATVFVPTGWLGRRPGWPMETNGDREEVVMTAEEIQALPSDLISIGSHTIDHPRLTTLAEPAAASQLGDSRAALEALMGRRVDTLAFPYGDHDGRVVALAEAAGYRHVFTVAPQAIRSGDTGISRGRTAADPADTMYLFDLKMRGGFDWMPVASRLKRALRPRS
jgi:peptidoglycan/xylan/chitin deacetylase (PgdA/CDA1 family)